MLSVTIHDLTTQRPTLVGKRLTTHVHVNPDGFVIGGGPDDLDRAYGHGEFSCTIAPDTTAVGALVDRAIVAVHGSTTDDAVTRARTLYAIGARVTIYDRSVPGQTSFHVQGLPTFYLDADVQGIVSADHARRIAVDMITSLGHSPDDVYVYADEVTS
jgi:hypothetical protein